MLFILPSEPIWGLFILKGVCVVDNFLKMVVAVGGNTTITSIKIQVKPTTLTCTEVQ